MSMSDLSQMGKPKFSIDEQIKRLEAKGVTFALYSKQKTMTYLEENNSFFRIKSYAKNYERSSRGKYSNLDFAYLVEFATIDLYFRRLILSWSLDIEHHLKLILLQHFNNNCIFDTIPPVTKNFGLAGREAKASLPFFMHDFFALIYSSLMFLLLHPKTTPKFSIIPS